MPKKVADLIRQAIGPRGNVTEKRMFGVDPMTRAADISRDMEPPDDVLERLIADAEARARKRSP